MKTLLLVLLSLPLMAQGDLNQAILANASQAEALNLAPARIRLLPQAGKLPTAENSGRALYRWSVVSVLAANAADIHSSWQMDEANPFVAGGSKHFNGTSIAIKTGLVGTSLLLQHVVLRHRPDLYKKLGWLNFVTAGGLAGVAKYNSGLK